jgi:hypothetical protein
MTWYAAVGFGPCTLPATASRSRHDVVMALSKSARRDESGWTLANSRVYGYATRAQARNGDISHDIGRGGRVF